MNNPLNSLSVNAEQEFTLISNENGNCVSARELHEKLKSNERFSKWWERFASYGFVENVDYVRGCTKKYAPKNQYTSEMQEFELDDYAITIEMAKQICMLQRSELGKKYREYFLKLERAWNSPEAIMARALQVANRTLEQAMKRAAIAESVVNRIADGSGCFFMNQTAKALKLPYGNIKLYERLRNEGILNADNTPKQEQINAGHFKVVVKFVNDKVGNKPVTLTTGKGIVYLAKKFNTTIDESVQPDENSKIESVKEKIKEPGYLDKSVNEMTDTELLHAIRGSKDD